MKAPPKQYYYDKVPDAGYHIDQFGQRVLTTEAKLVIAYCHAVGATFVPLKNSGIEELAKRMISYVIASGATLQVSGGAAGGVPGVEAISKYHGMTVCVDGVVDGAWLSFDKFNQHLGIMVRKRAKETLKSKTNASSKENKVAKAEG